jgi:hypothetical protein
MLFEQLQNITFTIFRNLLCVGVQTTFRNVVWTTSKYNFEEI